MMIRRRAVILPVVLMILVLLALLGAAFSFRIHADNASTQAVANRLQSRLAAEAGVEWVKLLLRSSRLERSVWYRNPTAFNRVILWAQDEDSKKAGTNEKLDGKVAYRFSIVGDDFSDDKLYTRFGLIDEASKVNLNVATERQLTILVTAAAAGDSSVDVKGVVDAILDWRDSDHNPRSETGGTEGVYYENLPRPYRVKNAPFDTVEELLLVKGVTGNLLYGEDFDRNGLLTDNEDDGDKSFPPDNEDGVLNRGLFPYLTVYSHETQTSNENRARVNLLGDEQALRDVLEEAFPDDPVVVNFCVAATRPVSAGGNSATAQDPNTAPQGNTRSNSPPQGNAPQADAPSGGTSGGNAPQGDRPRGGASLLPGEFDLPFNTGIEGGKLSVVAQRQPDTPAGQPDTGENKPVERGETFPGEPAQTSQNTDTPNTQGETPQGSDSESTEGENKDETDAQSGDAHDPSSPIRSPADLLFPRMINGEVQESPVGPEHLPALMDRTTVLPEGTRDVVGLINVDTAPRLVLRCIDGLTPDEVDAIVAQRDALDDQELSTTAWLVNEGILDNETYARIAPQITARAQQFRIQSIGYADHVGTVTRLEVIVDMNGPIAETVYYRDISYLGAPFPIREEDREQQNARE